MREIGDLRDIGPIPAIAVIVNCSTKLVTTLALASVLRRTRLPVLVIDCESTDGSRGHFAALAPRLERDFLWLPMPLARHGVTLDAVFDAMPAREVLLVDSDLEILDGRVVEAMAAALASAPDAYGAGFLHRRAWLAAQHGVRDRIGRYAERMWIPLVLLRTQAVRRARAGGASFAQRRDFAEFPGHPLLSRWAGMRLWIPGLRDLLPPRHAAGGDPAAPAFVEHDTGALVHAELLAEGLRFAALDESLWGDVHHFHGVTRSGLARRIDRFARRWRVITGATGTAQDAVGAMVRERLRSEYGLAVQPG
jgi:hypothetical protein